jgi:rhamnosyltransferase
VSGGPAGAAVTVAIPVRNGGELFAGVLRALAAQTVQHELLVCDSGSSDGSAQAAREHGARVIEIAPEDFNHGATRNLLIGEAAGEHVALLSHDAEPAGERWLEQLLEGFELGDDVALVYGPYRPRPTASAPVRLELERWFRLLAPGGQPRLDRLDPSERATLPAEALIGPRGFFTDANACIARAAWRAVPFREIAYAEDRALAVDMLRAGYAKAFMPAAAVVHSHDYSATDELRRGFDEWRGLLEVYGWREPAGPGHLLRRLRGELGHARRALAAEGSPPLRRYATLAAVSRHNVARLAGAVLGSRAERLPARARRALSLERRAGFQPLAPGPPGAGRTADRGT